MDVIIAEEFQEIISKDTIRNKSASIEAALNLVGVDYSVVFETDNFVQSLNKNYRKIDEPTDVLSFQANVIDPATQIKYLGDIIISVPTVQKQAIERNILLDDEISVMLVHGLLHLLGLDHRTLKDKQEMWKSQNEILRKLDVDSAAFPH